jgi:DNA-binding winged helix-turn-helix (wHTH) protein/tetratricopeptide (TPR) repeat protein
MDETRDLADTGARWRFGVFEFEPATLDLMKNGRVVSVRPQPVKLLTLLLARPGEVVSREDLQRALWPDDTFVDFEQGVNHAIRELRAALGDTAESPRFIQTLHRRGYRFIAPVQRVIPPATSSQPSGARIEQPTVESVVPPAPAPMRGPPAGLFRRMMTGVTLFAVFASIAFALWVARGQEDVPADLPAALTVASFSSPADPALGVGVARAISARLGGQQTLSVRSRTVKASTQDPESPWPPTHTLQGEITTNGPQVGALVRLENAAGQTIWSERIQVRADELFSLESVIAERVVAALRLRLAATEQERFRRRYTANSNAYSAYIRGLAALVRYTPESTLAAIREFEEALRHDPSYALARAGLAMACADMHLRFAPAGEVERWGERAEAESRAALALDSDLAEAHLARAALARKREFDWNATLAAARRALALNPNLEQARFFMAAAYYHHGYMEEALIETQKGRALPVADAVEPIRIEALVALFSGNFAPARARLEEVSRLSSGPIGDTYLALAYYYSGSTERATTMLASLAESRSASTAARAGAALAAVLAAQRDNAAAHLQIGRVLRHDYRDHHVAYSLGGAYAQLGEANEAQRWLRTAADTGFPCLPFFERDPLLDPLRSRPDFSNLLGYVRARRELSLSNVTSNR